MVGDWLRYSGRLAEKNGRLAENITPETGKSLNFATANGSKNHLENNNNDKQDKKHKT
ncbi:MAG: hypothetical protein II671_08285 [Salinivirgaceae bacterium]|nr:hypothetical protein [Salinivirgaceae bacterium]